MVEIGKINKLRVVKLLDFGAYLDGDKFGEILMPHKYVPEDCKVDDEVSVFVYYDSKDRIIATTEKPYAMVGDFAMLRVESVDAIGAFLDWGLIKDLLVPFREQTVKMEEGKSYIVYVYVDHESNRIAASSKLDKFLDNVPPEYEPGQEVEIMIVSQTDIGYKAIINNLHWGIVYKNEVFKPLKKGHILQAYIKKVRDDEKIDLTLYKPGYDKVTDVTDTIIDCLKRNGGFIEVTDKSPSETINRLFGVSKKTYKMAVGSLYKSKMINIEPSGIRLIKK